MNQNRCDSLSLSVQFDSNGDGQISLIELREAMKMLMREQVTNREINEILQDADLNGDGLVDFEGKINYISIWMNGHIITTGSTCDLTQPLNKRNVNLEFIVSTDYRFSD